MVFSELLIGLRHSIPWRYIRGPCWRRRRGGACLYHFLRMPLLLMMFLISSKHILIIKKLEVLFVQECTIRRTMSKCSLVNTKSYIFHCLKTFQIWKKYKSITLKLRFCGWVCWSNFYKKIFQCLWFERILGLVAMTQVVKGHFPKSVNSWVQIVF